MHFAKIPNQQVALCNALIPELEFKSYVDLWKSTKKRKMELTYMQISILEHKEDRLSSSTEKFLVNHNTRPKVATKRERYFESGGESKSIMFHQISVPSTLPSRK